MNTCHWQIAPVSNSIVKPGGSFVAGVQMEAFQDTSCYFNAYTADASGHTDGKGEVDTNLDVNAIDELTPKIVPLGDLGGVPTLDRISLELTAFSYQTN